MKILNGNITEVKYPKIYELITPCSKYPLGAVVEEYINGEELRKSILKINNSEKREIGRVLARFINQVHNINIKGNKEEEININLSKFDKSLGILKEYINDTMFQKLIQIKEVYKQLLQEKDFCLTHGDLNEGNIMIENGKVSGVIDFGNMEYYIPEIEFVHMYFFDKVIYEAMVKNYPKQINEKNIVFLELIVNIRHFKNIRNFEDKKNKCLQNIETLLNEYLNM